MQKVVGSSPIIRSREPAAQAGFFVGVEGWKAAEGRTDVTWRERQATPSDGLA
jgi:hypothetical protein